MSLDGRLVVVGALAAVVPQVERGLDGLVAARVLGLVVRPGPQSGYMSYIGPSLLVSVGWMLSVTSRRATEDRRPAPRIAWTSGRIIDQERAGRACCGSPPRDCVLRRGRKARNAELRGEVALLSGPAAAVDEYEHAPHDGTTVRRAAAGAHPISPNRSACETASPG